VRKKKRTPGEESYRGGGKLAGKKAVITGGDSGIGRVAAIAYAREGADVLIAYLNEHGDAKETQRLVEEAGRKALLVAGDIGSSKHCRAIVHKALAELGGIDILINNAAHQATFKSIEDISDEEWELTFRVNIHAMFYLTKPRCRTCKRRCDHQLASITTSPIRRSTMSEDTVEDFGKNVPMKRPGQPAELATAYVMLADPLSSYVSGATIAVTGGKPIL
jgi:NAD(P)-dependent dehydrogenase (short-subunit alcohol dehydrogenase family)